MPCSTSNSGRPRWLRGISGLDAVATVKSGKGGERSPIDTCWGFPVLEPMPSASSLLSLVAHLAVLCWTWRMPQASLRPRDGARLLASTVDAPRLAMPLAVRRRCRRHRSSRAGRVERGAPGDAFGACTRGCWTEMMASSTKGRRILALVMAGWRLSRLASRWPAVGPGSAGCRRCCCSRLSSTSSCARRRSGRRGGS